MALWDKYSKDEADNGFSVPQGGAPEGWNGEDVNNFCRSLMAELRQFVERIEWQWPLDDIENDRVAQAVGNHGYTISKVSGTEVQIQALGAAAIAVAEKYYVPGRRCRVQTTTVSVDATIVSTSDNTIDYNIVFEAIDGNSGAIPASPTDVGVYAIDPSEGSANGMLLFSGVGTTAERDARFPTITAASDLLLWFNTTTDRLEVAIAGTWEAVQDSVLLASSGSPDAAASQTIQAGLLSNTGTIEAPTLRGSTAVTTPEFRFEGSTNLKRATLAHDDTNVLLTLLDTDESSVLAVYRFAVGGSIAVDRQDGEGFINLTGARFYNASASETVDFASSGSEQEAAFSNLGGVAIPSANGDRFLIGIRGDFDTTGNIGNPEFRGYRLRIGPLGTIADPEVLKFGLMGTGGTSLPASLGGHDSLIDDPIVQQMRPYLFTHSLNAGDKITVSASHINGSSRSYAVTDFEFFARGLS